MSRPNLGEMNRKGREDRKGSGSPWFTEMLKKNHSKGSKSIFGSGHGKNQ
jgi:hypothetical protein